MPSGRGPDWTRAVSKDPELSRNFNLKKLIRKPKQAGVAEEIIDGVTHDSIAEYVESTKKRSNRRPERAGWTGRLRFWRRSR